MYFNIVSALHSKCSGGVVVVHIHHTATALGIPKCILKVNVFDCTNYGN